MEGLVFQLSWLVGERAVCVCVCLEGWSFADTVPDLVPMSSVSLGDQEYVKP